MTSTKGQEPATDDILVQFPRDGNPNLLLRPSPTCEALLHHFEQCRLKAYMPTPDDVPTIGWGSTTYPRTGEPVKMGDVITQAEADEMFSGELAKRAAAVVRLLGSSPTTQPQFDALLSFAYNVGHGRGGLSTSTLLRHHRAGFFSLASLQFSRWNKQKGKVLRGLTKRRAYEAALYRTPEGKDPPWLIRGLSGQLLVNDNWGWQQ